MNTGMSFNWGFNFIFISYLCKWIIWINSIRWEFIFREIVYLRGDMRWPPSTLHLVVICTLHLLWYALYIIVIYTSNLSWYIISFIVICTIHYCNIYITFNVICYYIYCKIHITLVVNAHSGKPITLLVIYMYAYKLFSGLTEPIPAVTDCWAQGSVPRQMCTPRPAEQPEDIPEEETTQQADRWVRWYS